MPKFRVTMPDGSKRMVTAPEGTTPEQAYSYAARSDTPAPKSTWRDRPSNPVLGWLHDDMKARVQGIQADRGKAGFTDVLSNAAANLGDEASGIAGVLRNAVTAPFSGKVDFNPVGAYTQGKADEQKRLADYQSKNPIAAAGANVLGSVAGLRPGKAFALAARAPTLVGRMVQGAKAAAPFGAVQGAGGGEGFVGRLESAAQGALGAAALGGGLPLLGAAGRQVAKLPGVKAAIRPFTSATSRVADLVTRAMSADGINPTDAGAAMDAASGLGFPAMLADQGDNLRRLAGSVARQPGPSRTMMTTALRERMAGQNDRVVNAIDKDLGPITAVDDASEALIAKAKKDAAPLYEKAHAAPGVASDEITSLLATPAGKSALKSARTIAANDRIDPNRIGIDLDEQGEPLLTSVPTMQTLDYVKQGLDEMLESFRDPITRQLKLSPAGRAINGVRAQLLKEMDRLNPDYAAARSAYAGPAAEKDALNLGKQMFGKPAQQITRATRTMTPTQREQFKLGYRSAMADKSGKLVDNANRPAMLTGAPEKRAALQEVFGDNPNLPTFLDKLGHEASGIQTHNTALTGSPTAVNLGDDALTGDSSILGDAAGGAINLAQGQVPWGLFGKALRGAGDAMRFGTGNTGQDVRQGLAALLSETDPSALSRALDERQAVIDLNRAKWGDRRLGIGQIIGSWTGMPPAQPPVDGRYQQ